MNGQLFLIGSDSRIDPKLGSLSDAHHRVWFNLLCFAVDVRERGRIVSSERLLAVHAARGDVKLLREACENLAELQVITYDAADPQAVTVEFVNFDRRQNLKPSAAPSRVAERVAKHRARKREEALRNGQNEPQA